MTIVIKRVSWKDSQKPLQDIRHNVFIKEQNISKSDEWDGLDSSAAHYIALSITSTDQSIPVACARVIEKLDTTSGISNINSSTIKIGRVAVIKNFRGLGIASKIINKITHDYQQSGFAKASLDSQTYIIELYEKLGFKCQGEEFLDAGIPHFNMYKTLK